VLLGAALWRSRAAPRSAGLLIGITPLIHLARDAGLGNPPPP
jgi:hypothetical protein